MDHSCIEKLVKYNMGEITTGTSYFQNCSKQKPKTADPGARTTTIDKTPKLQIPKHQTKPKKLLSRSWDKQLLLP